MTFCGTARGCPSGYAGYGGMTADPGIPRRLLIACDAGFIVLADAEAEAVLSGTVAGARVAAMGIVAAGAEAAAVLSGTAFGASVTAVVISAAGASAIGGRTVSGNLCCLLVGCWI